MSRNESREEMHPKITLASLLGFITVFSFLIIVGWSFPPILAVPVTVLLSFVAPATATIGIVYGTSAARTFSVGAIIPQFVGVVISLIFMAAALFEPRQGRTFLDFFAELSLEQVGQNFVWVVIPLLLLSLITGGVALGVRIALERRY